MANRSEFNVNIPEFPYANCENNQLIGFISECKHCFQCGHLYALCTNPESITKYCLYGWFSGGLIPDKLCSWCESNEYWVNISTNYYISRNNTVAVLQNQNLTKANFTEQALRLGNIYEYVNKPMLTFLMNCPKEITKEQIIERWKWLDIGSKKPIYRIEPNDDIEKLTNDLSRVLDYIDNLGHTPSIILEWDESKSETTKVLFNVIKDREDIMTVNIATRLVHGEEIQTNEIINLTNINSDLWAYSLVNIFKDRTIMCVAGGPSLTKQLQIIKQYRDRFILICASTVAHILHDHGIIPDIIGTIDMKEENVRYLKALTEFQMKQSYLLYEVDANSNVIDYYNGNRILLVADIFDTPITNGILQYIKSPNVRFSKSGTVANMMYQFAKLLGANRILLAGYDFCYSSHNSHVDGALFSQSIKVLEGEGGKFLQYGDDTAVDQAIEVMANNGNVSVASKSLYTYLVELNIRINSEPMVETIDFSDIGAKKENASFHNIEEYLSTLPVIEWGINTPINVLNSIDRKIMNRSSIKKLLESILNGQNFGLIKQNHLSKLAFLLRQYNYYPEIKYDGIDRKILKLIDQESTKKLTPIIKLALERFKQKGVNNG